MEIERYRNWWIYRTENGRFWSRLTYRDATFKSIASLQKAMDRELKRREWGTHEEEEEQ